MELVGRYRIEARIGEGAMADVYRAHDPSIGRTLAIKILKTEFRQSEEIVGRFLREARAAGALSHPHIVTIYDVGEADGYPYIAMELLGGAPLDEHIQAHGAMAPADAARIGSQIAEALGYAHGLGVVHRDIKPSNIMLSEDGRTAKILDFGIARVGEADRVRAELAVLRTQVGQVLGTPRYMSPEQALGLPVDHRSDLFSLGVVLYELLSGRPAFDGAGIATIAIQITQERPKPLERVLDGCPAGLSRIVDRLLAKQPERRFQSGADLAAALAREGETLAAGPEAGRRRLSMPARLTLVMTSVTAIALLLSVFAVLDRQYRAMEQMALTSGTAISRFLANNVALRAVDNAGLPPHEQDWLPVQAFIAAASGDAGVRRILMVDADGIVRGADDPALVGTRYAPPAGERALRAEAEESVTLTPAGDFRFRRPILYAGQPFGAVELVTARDALAAASAGARRLLLALGVVLVLVVAGLSYAIARGLARPIRQLRSALDDAANGRRDVRIAHRRRDEFGILFDRFNALADRLEEERAAPARPGAGAPAPDATMIASAPDDPRLAAIRRRTA